MSETPEERRPEPSPPSMDQLPSVVRDEYPMRRYGQPAQGDEGYGDLIEPAEPQRRSSQRTPDIKPLSWPLSEIQTADEDESTFRVRPAADVPGQPPQQASPRTPPPQSASWGGPAPLYTSAPPPSSPDSAAIPAPLQGNGYPQPVSSPTAEEGAVRIGLWGSPASGKTTYLAALRHAVGNRSGDCGIWNIFARNTESADLLVRFTDKLVNSREFPESTLGDVLYELQWLFVGDIAGTRFDNRARLLRRGGMASKFLLDLIDVAGGAFADDPAKAHVALDIASRALDHLESAAGLIYLFDPIGERTNRNSATYVNRMLVELQQRHAAAGRTTQYLDQHVAICITKFDHPKVFQRARELGLVNWGADGMPRIRDEHATQFFDAICAGDFWAEQDEAGQASAQFVRDQLASAFNPKKIRYYVTSSIGFRQPPGWTPSAATGTNFDPDDFANFYTRTDGKQGIRGAIRPINVLEPLIGVAQQLRKRQR